MRQGEAEMLPKRTQRYNGQITEAHRWESFRHRPDDIFICTPPKCGTTWTQTIVAMLVFGRADIEVEPGTVSPWLDANFAPPEVINSVLENQSHRRFIKTHTPLDGIPFFPECTYLAIYRDPRDVYFSMINHLKNMTAEWAEKRVPRDLREGFREWARAPLVEGLAQQNSLSFLVHHFESFWRYRQLPNLHFFHYSDMLRDLPGSIETMGKAIGISTSPQEADRMARTASFTNMKAKADQFAPGAKRGGWKVNANFFDSGRAERWRDILDDDDLALYRKEFSKLLRGEAARWFEQGGLQPADA
jgi:aryl sulfotransferase